MKKLLCLISFYICFAVCPNTSFGAGAAFAADVDDATLDRAVRGLVQVPWYNEYEHRSRDADNARVLQTRYGTATWVLGGATTIFGTLAGGLSFITDESARNITSGVFGSLCLICGVLTGCTGRRVTAEGAREEELNTFINEVRNEMLKSDADKVIFAAITPARFKASLTRVLGTPPAAG
jgi:hypothetical protein